MVAETPLLVDPNVSRAKFERELLEYRLQEDEYLRRGWWLLKAEFPEVFVVFANPKLKPVAAVIFGAVINFENYDLWAPSVKLVDPFTREPYKYNELPTKLLRRKIIQQPAPAGMPNTRPGQMLQIAQDTPLMMAHSPEEIPFLCLPGIREYHEHPGHSGDSWLLHRNSGEGTLYFILDNLYQYGVLPINSFGIQMQITLNQGEPPV